MSNADDDLPAYALPVEESAERRILTDWPPGVSRDWAWGGSRGAGVKVCIVDSGIDATHPMVGAVQEAITPGEEGVTRDELGDVSGHGTACAGIIRGLAPECELGSARVLGPDIGGTGRDLLAGLRWAIDSGYDVINMSLSTTRQRFIDALHELADLAYFRRSIIVCAAHNMPIDSWPWRFASVFSVAGHTGADPLEVHANPEPPVEFLARGVDVEVAWQDGSVIQASGNSFAAPHVAGICALIRAKHPSLTPLQVKSVLYLLSANVENGRAG